MRGGTSSRSGVAGWLVQLNAQVERWRGLFEVYDYLRWESIEAFGATDIALMHFYILFSVYVT